jgi:dihydrofolate reductase
LAAGLVDELQLVVNPGVAAEGERIFPAALPAQRFEPIASTTFECGVVLTRWAAEG